MPLFHPATHLPPRLMDSQSALVLRSRIERAQARDMAAIGELYHEFGVGAYGAAFGLLGSAPDAEDVVQDVFCRLPGALRGFTGTAVNFPGWLRRVVVRQSLMLLRAGRRRREVDVDGVAALLAPADRPVERLDITAALERIPEPHRTVFLLKEVEGYDHAEIAELLGITRSNSEVRLHRARRQLRDLLGGSRS